MNFHKDEINEILKELNLSEDIELSKIPEIDLYMDQVIQLFENNLENMKRNPEDKLLTKTMINNYAKDKILIPVKNKRYSKNHIILMIFIYSLKQGLSIGDIKVLFNPMVDKLSKDERGIDLPNIYERYLKLKEKQVKEEEAFLNSLLEEIHINKDEVTENYNDGYESILLTVLLLLNSSNTRKRLAEKIIDKYLL